MVRLKSICVAFGALFLVSVQAHAQNTPVINPMTPLPYPFAASGAMQSQLSVTTGATVALTVPKGTLYAVVCLRSGAASGINYSYDALTTPTTGTTGNGFQISAGQCLSVQGIVALNAFKMIAVSATTAVDIGYSQ